MQRFAGMLAVIVVLLLHAGSAIADTPVAEVARLQLYSSFWQNLHHFLYVSAWQTRLTGRGTFRLAMPIPDGPVMMLPADEAGWDAAVSYYDRKLASKNLLFDAGMTRIKIALTDPDDSLRGSAIDADLRATLLAAAPIYRKYYWANHDAANRAWIADAVQRTTPVAQPIIDRLTRLYGTQWFTTPVRVDVVRAGQSQGAYTSNEPTPHIVVASADASYGQWAATEMLFHESSHPLIRNVSSAIDRAGRAANKQTRDLWHVVLFSMAGEVTRQTLEARGVQYSPYLYALGLFDTVWPRLEAPVELLVRPYVDGKTTLDQMAADLVAALP
jgi:hypothetical protein